MKFRQTSTTIVIYILLTLLCMTLLNKASEDQQIISPDDTVITTEMQNDVVQPIQLLHSIKPHILSIIFNQFLTIREMLTLRNTCQHFKILLFQKNDNTADVVMFCKHSGSKELDNVPLILSNVTFFFSFVFFV